MQILDSTDQNELSFPKKEEWFLLKIRDILSWMIFIEDKGHFVMNDFFLISGTFEYKDITWMWISIHEYEKGTMIVNIKKYEYE